MKLVRTEASSASYLIVIDKTNTAHVSLASNAAGLLSDYLHSLGKSYAEYKIDFEKCKRIINLFLTMPPHLTRMPKLVGFKSDPDIVMNRLSFDPSDCSIVDIEKRAPVFSQLMRRMTNWEAFMMRLGSLFDPETDRKQAVYIYGPPDCGKSILGWLIQQVAGATAIVGAEDTRDKYFKSRFLAKRAVIVQEATATFLRSELFKAVTGDDYHTIEQKYAQPFTVELLNLMFFFSNHEPEIPNDPALIERIIACRCESIPKDKMRPVFEVRADLLKELPDIVGACVDLYRSQVRPGERIPCKRDELEECIAKYESETQDILLQNFVFEEGAILMKREFKAALNAAGIYNNRDIGRYKKMLITKNGVFERRVTIKNNSGSSNDEKNMVHAYFGVRLRNHDEKATSLIM